MKIEDGRTIFYQWDIGQRILIEHYPAGTEVHFALKPRSAFDAIRYDQQVAMVVTTYSDGTATYADVPNLLLQTAGTLYVYIYPSEDDEAHTDREESFRIAPRPRPSDYVYTEEEILRWTSLERSIAQNSEEIKANGAEIKAINIKIAASDAEIAKNSAAIADLLYKPMEITSLSNSIGTAELGATVNMVTLTWSLNKEPVSQTVEGEAAEPSARSATLTDLGLTANKTFTVTATDERELTAQRTTSISFCNGVYYGVWETGTAASSSAILALTKKLQSGKALTFTVTAGASQQIAYALPARYGTPNFNVGGFDGGFSKAATIDFTNASGYTERYDLWLSDNTGLGSTTVKAA